MSMSVSSCVENAGVVVLRWFWVMFWRWRRGRAALVLAFVLVWGIVARAAGELLSE